MNIINIEYNMNTKYIVISKETAANVTENSMNIVNIMNTNNIERIIFCQCFIYFQCVQYYVSLQCL